MGQGMTNTLIELLEDLSKRVASAMHTLPPDSQPQLQALLDTFVAMSHQQASAQVTQVNAAGGASPQSPLSQPAAPAFGQSGGPGMGGLMQGPPNPNPDELRRMLSQ